MSSELRILHLADSHIGAQLPARPRTRRRSRGDDIVDSYRRVLDQARRCDAQLVLHAGDVFDLPTPGPAALNAAAAPLLELAAEGVAVVIVPGNHERSALPASLLLSHPNIHIIDRPRTITLQLGATRVAVAGLPCLRRSVARDFDAALAQTDWSSAAGDLNILLLHQTIESSTCGPAGFRFRSGEDVLDRDRIPAAFQYVALGHVHRPQALASLLPGGPPLVYAGSPDRISFAERDEPKGCVLVRWDGGPVRHEFLEHAVRPMCVVPLDVSGLSRGELEAALFDALRAAPPEAIVNLRLSGQTAGRTLRGMQLQRRGQALRPDLSLSVAMQQVEIVPERQVQAAGGADDLFAAWPAMRTLRFGDGRGEPAGVVRGSVERLGELEDTCGAYALRDHGGRLLYVGKAARLRTRLRTHISGRGAAEFFRGWTRQIASFEARAACSELEALLIEAELIRTRRPPFNRQMKSWSRYVYLTLGRRAYGQIDITAEPDPDALSIGPYRSRMSAELVIAAVAAATATAACPPDHPAATGAIDRRGRLSLPSADVCARFYAGLCGGPCGGRIAAGDYAARLAARDELLLGRSDGLALQWEQVLAGRVAAGANEAALRPLQETADALRFAHDSGAALRAADGLLGGVAAVGADEGLRLFSIADERGAAIVATAARAAAGPRGSTPQACVPKALADLLLTVVRTIAREPAAGRVLRRDESAGDPRQLWAAVQEFRAGRLADVEKHEEHENQSREDNERRTMRA